jgi:hypothetical protein
MRRERLGHVHRNKSVLDVREHVMGGYHLDLTDALLWVARI